MHKNKFIIKVSLLLGVCGMAVLLASQAFASGTWTSKASAPSARNNLHGGFINGKFYVAGGHGGSVTTGVLEIYNPATDSWSSGASMPYNGSYYAYQGAAGVIDNKLYIAGGWNTPFFIYPHEHVKNL